MTNPGGGPQPLIGAIATAALFSVAIAATSVGAQGGAVQRPNIPTGFRLGLSGWAGRPYLGGSAATYLRQFGQLGFGAGGGLELGLDFTHIGVSAGVEYGQTSFGRDTPPVAAFSLMVHWTPTLSAMRRWQPLLSAGLVRDEIDLGPVPTGDRTFDFPHFYGTGARLGLAAAHSLGSRVAFTLGVTGDILSVDLRSPAGPYYVHHRGWGVYPRLVAGLRWWPFSRGSR